jgi:deazaflavin-dependent oxidoreductase (nitroreductase family)
MAEPARERRPMSRYERLFERLAQTKTGAWLAINVANRIDRVLLPLTNGRFSISGPGIPIGRLTSIGAKSGVERHTPLLYTTDGERIVLVASKGGAVKHPAWYHNVRAHPQVRFLSKKGERGYRAAEATGEERDRLWALVNDVYAGYDTYQERTERKIPVIVLEPDAA